MSLIVCVCGVVCTHAIHLNLVLLHFSKTTVHQHVPDMMLPRSQSKEHAVASSRVMVAALIHAGP